MVTYNPSYPIYFEVTYKGVLSISISLAKWNNISPHLDLGPIALTKPPLSGPGWFVRSLQINQISGSRAYLVVCYGILILPGAAGAAGATGMATALATGTVGAAVAWKVRQLRNEKNGPWLFGVCK